jgi:hypothetical protein
MGVNLYILSVQYNWRHCLYTFLGAMFFPGNSGACIFRHDGATDPASPFFHSRMNMSAGEPSNSVLFVLRLWCLNLSCISSFVIILALCFLFIFFLLGVFATTVPA